ncbi:MAG: hypothetical protein KC619_32135 [Myxococcales bacterium]|nr:hypothetical protein [Myxococcales bacterium]
MDELRVVGMGEDFAVGRYVLSKHLGIRLVERHGATHSLNNTWVSVLSGPGPYARQLSLKLPSDFSSGRVPLFICPCGDTMCGALTVAIEATPASTVIWADFGWERPDARAVSRHDFHRRTGPFEFDAEQYRGVLAPYR